MTRGDSPEFRFGGLRGDAIEETSPFPSPRAQVLAQDRRLRVVRNLLDPNRLMLAPEAQFTPTSRAKVPHPLGFSARRHQIALPANLQRIYWRCADVPRLSPAYNQDARPANT